MPITKSAIKERRKNIRRQARNKSLIIKMKLAVKKFRKAKTAEEAAPLIKAALSIIDKAKTKKIIHKGQANRKKSRLTLALNKLKAAVKK